MKRLTHSNNTCTVGWTCIHAIMSPDDMRELLAACPEGSFTATWYHPKRDIRTPDDFEQYLNDENARRKERGYGYMTMSDAGFYFNFPRDEVGEALLAKLFSPEDIAPNQWKR